MIYYKHLIITIVASILFTNTYAHKEYILQLDTVFHKVKQASYGGLRVIDMRNNRAGISELRIGVFGGSKDVVTPKPLPELLHTYYSRMLVGNRNADKELLLVLYSFEVSDKPNAGAVSTFYFDGDFFGGSEGKYVFLGKIDSLYEMPLTRQKVLEATQYKINTMLVEYATQRLQRNYDLTEQETVKRRQRHKAAYPIYKAGEFKKGIYYTVEQFLNNEPVDTPFIKSENTPWDGKKELYFYYPNAKGKKGKQIKRDTYFAIYDGKEWAVPGHFFSVKLKFQDGDFYADLPFRGIDGNVSVGSAAAVGGILGGAIGGAVAGAIISSSEKEYRTMWGVYRARFDPEIKGFVRQKRLN